MLKAKPRPLPELRNLSEKRGYPAQTEYLIMTYTAPKTKVEVLSYADRSTIAAVLTWDNCGKAISPWEIEAIKTEEDIVIVKVTNIGNYHISRYMFRSILEAQRSNINKQIDAIIKVESAETVTNEREWSDILHADAQAVFDAYLEVNSYDWTTEPIGVSICASPDTVFGNQVNP